MLNAEELEREILALEKRDTTYTTCERLAWLYIVRDHLAESGKARIAGIDKLGLYGDSEFLRLCAGKDLEGVFCVLDELMGTLASLNGGAYRKVMNLLAESG